MAAPAKMPQERIVNIFMHACKSNVISSGRAQAFYYFEAAP
jgi:hypothetical protein